jgi:hypothetical protein
MLACRVLGHRYRFRSEQSTLMWACGRCGHVGGTKTYPTSAQAQHYAEAFDREDSDDLGRRAPLIGLLPLRLAHLVRRLRGRG